MLTERGRDVLERNRWSSVREELKWAAVEREFDTRRDIDDERSRRHTRYAVHRPRELTHDAQVYRAYLKDAARLREDGAFIRRVILDHELKREYQQVLQERNRGKSESDGRPDRDRDGHLRTHIEVETLHYRGAHASSKASSGFSRHSAGAARVVGDRGSGGGGGRRGSGGLGISASTNGRSGGRPFDPRIAEELLR